MLLWNNSKKLPPPLNKNQLKHFFYPVKSAIKNQIQVMVTLPSFQTY